MKAIETERLFLRKWQKSDVVDLFNIMKNPSVIMGGWKPHSNINASIEILNEYIESNERWAIELKNTGKVIGSIRVYPDNNRGKFFAKTINYVLSEDYCGNGYMTEAVKRIIEYLFEELNIDLLSAFIILIMISPKKSLKDVDFSMKLQ